LLGHKYLVYPMHGSEHLFPGLHFPSLTSLFCKRISEADRGFSFSFASSGTHFG
jgi:hypothetical protein